ncbi:MAG TPA: dihydrofolate reductase [Candidatus Paceibacterota bacterium]|nr:dihydrofolate reductase [Candidatus Paceibacterota bacterium]
MSARVAITVAIGRDREIGLNGKLLWHIPDDLKRFKNLTLGHPVIMGRKTFESILNILGKPLPGRTNIVITRDQNWSYEGVLVFHSLEEALAKAHELEQEEIHIGGGSDLYKQALPFVDRLYLTLVDDTKEADTYFPEYEQEFTKKISEEVREQGGLKYTWVTLERE